MMCDICGDSKRVRLPILYAELNARHPVPEFEDYSPAQMEPGYRDFPCPQCVPTVPSRRVRAMKVVSAYGAEEFGKFQMPIERSLAARFGEYLLREGLIRFSQTGSKDLGAMADKITVTAHLGVVSREDVVRSGAVPEVATTAAPAIPEKIRRRAKLPPGSKQWVPPGASWPVSDEPITDEFDEPKDAIASRFSGLEI